MFESGLEFLRADFHLHTQKDKEFSYSGEPNDFVKSYISALKQANISVGVITNHNKFDKDEYKALKRAASKEKIFILPGVELTVKEGANGIHTLIVFNPDEWLENGNNHKEYKESLIKNIFGSGGKATLSVVDKHGKHYIVSRIYGEQSNVIDENGLDLNIQPSSLFDGIQYFGQKDLSNSADHENGLLEKLVGGKIGKSAEITSCVKELTTSVSQLLDANKIPEQIEEYKIKKSEVEHKMSIYKEKGVAEKLKKQTGYTTDKAKLDYWFYSAFPFAKEEKCSEFKFH